MRGGSDRGFGYPELAALVIVLAVLAWYGVLAGLLGGLR